MLFAITRRRGGPKTGACPGLPAAERAGMVVPPPFEKEMLMTSLQIRADALSNIPWQERPSECSDPLWRYSKNPIVKARAIAASTYVHNSAVIAHEGKFAGVFRIDNRSRRMQLHAGRSDDGLEWKLAEEPIRFRCDDPEIGNFSYGYDPRLVRLDGRVYVIWCNGYHGPTIGLGYTEDFETFHQLENALLPFNRNGVLFPRRIGDSYCLLSRPSDSGHTPFGEIYLSRSTDLIHWGRHRHVMSPIKEENGWQSTKIGAGPAPIETSEGWLLVYHGVVTTCNGFVYSMGAALLDLDEPWKVIARSDPYLLTPSTEYECVGNVPNVVFPCAALVDSATGRLVVYYGCADTVVGVAFGYVQELVAFVRDHAVAGVRAR
jgi:beta-1,4-mannooligosaccharide/beta-1,4-mannosyl-N-acetylglucosamine phosphorylase